MIKNKLKTFGYHLVVGMSGKSVSFFILNPLNNCNNFPPVGYMDNMGGSKITFDFFNVNLLTNIKVKKRLK